MYDQGCARSVNAMTARHAQPGHRHLDHTGDVAFELWAPTEEALLREGALAAAEILVGGELPRPTSDPRAGRPSLPEHRTLRLDTIDREDRLVQWLNEVIYLAVHEGQLVVDAELELQDQPGGGALTARVRLAPLGPGELDTELKSATYHDLRVQRDEDGAWRARVVIDV
jgi:SHS2 domain-containing protein